MAEKVICADCRHCIQHGWLAPRCGATRIAFDSYDRECFRYCAAVNDDGNCPVFEPKPPTWLERILRRFHADR